MKKIIWIFILLFVFLFEDMSFAQEGKIYGRIFIPVVKKESRTFRGRVYRNRLARKKRKKDNENKRSPFQDAVIAAYPLSFKAKIEPVQKARVIQKNAEFIPNVLAITPGTQVEFINIDKFYHNVFSITPGANFNIGRRPTNTIIRRTIKKAGSIKIFCDIHSQMNGTIVTVNTPYFTQGNKNGVYLLDNLPQGKYRLEIIHPDFPKTTATIDLGKDEKIEQSFTLAR